MASPTSKRIETLAVHAGQGPDPATGAIAQPIYLSTTFERDADGSYPRGFTYSRESNPNRAALEACVAALEGGQSALAFSSGMGVATAVLQSLKPGAHIVAPDDVYHGLKKLIEQIFASHGIETTYVDMTDPAQVAAAIRPGTGLIWIETPSNPLLKITDLEKVSAVAKQAGVTTVCDSTFATPVLQHPLKHGIDMVMHSTTKYFAGHSDVTGGVLITARDNPVFERARAFQRLGGVVPSPFDSWLTLRGIATLPCRVRAQSDSALQIAQFLANHPAVEGVFYPGLLQHPHHDVAVRQMSLFGGVLSFLVKGPASAAMRVAGTTEIFKRATSLGGTHSLIEHRASVEGPQTKTPQNLLRLSIGLENPLDLIEDLERALSTCSSAT